MVLNSNFSVFDIKHMMASSSVANVCRHFASEVLSHVRFTASWYRSFLSHSCGTIQKNEITCVIHSIMVPSFFLGHNEITCVIHRGFYTQTLLHAVAFTPTHTHFHTQRLLHTDPFTHRGFYTQTLLHTDTFTHRSFYTHTHTRFSFTHTHTFTHKGFYTQTLTQKLEQCLPMQVECWPFKQCTC